MKEKTDYLKGPSVMPFIFMFALLTIPASIFPSFPFIQKIVIFSVIGIIGFTSFNRKKYRWDFIDVSIILFILVQVFSFFHVEYPAAIWPKIAFYGFMWLLYFFFKTRKTEILGLKWNGAIILVSCVNILWVTLTFLAIAYQGKAGFNFTEYVLFDEFIGANTNYIASILALQIPFLYQIKGQKFKKIPYAWVLISVNLSLIFLLNSKGISLAILTLIFYTGFNSFKKSNLAKIFIGISLIGFIGLLLLASINDKSKFFNAYNPIPSLLQENNDERLKLWNDAFQLFLEKPILGHGNGHFRIEYLKYGLDNYKFSKDNFIYLNHAHSFLFEHLAENGLLGVLMFFMLLIYPLINALRKKNMFNFQLSILLLFLTTFYSFTHGNHLNFSPHLFVWVFLLSQLEMKTLFKSKHFHKGIFFILLIASFIFNSWYFLVKQNLNIHRDLATTSFLDKAQKLESLYNENFMVYFEAYTIKEKIAAAYWKHGERQKSIEAIEKSITQNPYKANNWFYLGQRLMALKEYKNGMTAFLKALEINPSLARVKIEIAKSALRYNDLDLYQKYSNEVKDELEHIFEKDYKEAIWYNPNKKNLDFWRMKCYYLDQLLLMEESLIDRLNKNHKQKK